MKLLIDLGNTRLKFALAEEGHVRYLRAFPHAAVDFVEQLAEWVEISAIPDSIWLASVAEPSVTRTVLDVFERAGHKVNIAQVQDGVFGLKIAYAQAERLGVDRWLAMLGARASSEDALMLASVGSALVIDAIDVAGKHLGGLIGPTPEAMREALFMRVPQLRGATGEVARFATDTGDAVESGCLLAGAALIERSYHELADRVGALPKLLVSGGGSVPLRPWLPAHEWRPHLVLEGLARWADAVESGTATQAAVAKV
mgnify:CR=1 FL=1